jgi:hypothetical protein
MNNEIQKVHQLNMKLAGEQRYLKQTNLILMQARQRVAQAKFELDNAVLQIKTQQQK